MAKNTPIEWTDHSWPVLNGCRRKSEGCRNCYAERLIATRLRHTAKYKGLAVYTEGGPRWTGESRLWLPDLDMPLKLRKPSRIFVVDMGDLFFEGNSNEEIAAVFGVLAAAPQHTFQVLTKRPERAAAWFKWIAEQEHPEGGPSSADVCGVMAANYGANVDWLGLRAKWPLPHVWLGVSAENQATADERIPILLKLPASVRFVSAEPLLGPLQLDVLRTGDFDSTNGLTGEKSYAGRGSQPGHTTQRYRRGLDWVIVGGESGNGARPFELDWARSIVKQCAEAGVACFVKQLGAQPLDGEPGAEECQVPLRLAHRKGGDMAEWPPELRVRQYPEARRG